MDKEKIYRLIAWASSGLMIFFGVLLLILTASWRGLNKNIRSLETMLADAVKETAQLKSEIKELAANSEESGETGEVKADGAAADAGEGESGSVSGDKGGDALAETDEKEIGRASCRERVCAYV